MTESPPPPSTRRSRLAHLPGPLTRLSLALRRAIERGDPRLGLGVGVLVSLLVAWAFVRPVEWARLLDLKMLDLAFQHRSPIRESPDIVLVDMDDNTFRKLRWPVPREYWGQVVLALDRLGAKEMVFDVEFKSVVPRRSEFDPETGAYILEPGDKLLRHAISKSGRVLLAYHFDELDPLEGPYRAAFPRLKETFSKNMSAEPREVAKATGLPEPEVANQLELLRDQAVVSVVADVLNSNPKLSFAELRQRFLPSYDARLHKSELAVLQYAFWHWKGIELLRTKSASAEVNGLPARCLTPQTVVPPHFPFLENCLGTGSVNSVVDFDGVMRRPWTILSFRERPALYLGLEGALRHLSEPGTPASARVFPDRIEILTGKSGAQRQGTLRLNDEGRVLVNWAGNRRRKRGLQDYFVHIPFTEFMSFYNARYDVLDANVRSTIAQVAEEDRPAHMTEYLKLSDALAGILSSRREAPAAEVRALEEKMDAIRAKLVDDLASDIAAIDEQIPKLADKKRLQERLQQQRANLAGQRAGLTAADEQEKALRPLVQGKLCIIGSASTASGDLQPTPLGAATPGVDVVANVANMALTAQSIRNARPWANFAFVFAAGIAVSFAVTHLNTTVSLLATVATSGICFGVYWILFTGPVILVSGFGPTFSAGVTFGLVAAFKELVTQRSKRKLQRELEKNTSPELVKILMEHPEFISRPRKMTGTFFFSDVKSFTSISEKMSADVLFPFINRYLDRMTLALKSHLAFVDKYIGDGIMALFGVPVASSDHARNACLAALDCQAAMKGLNEEFLRDGLPQIKVRIGIHSGDVNAGAVGAVDRSNYTVLGDAVNLASRLEGANKEYDTQITISESTWNLVQGQFLVRELDRIRVVGKRNAVRIFELIAPAGAIPPMDPRFLEAYNAALKIFQARRWQESIDAFERALAIKPGDKPCENYIARANEFLVNPPPADWEGVFDLHSK